jgi:hypothetical protein
MWLAGAAGVACAQPANDACENAAPIASGATTFSNLGATTDGPDEPGTCDSAGYTQIGSDVWFRYTSGPCISGPTTVSTCGSSFDTKIAVYADGPCPMTPDQLLACSDDSMECGPGSLQSLLQFFAEANASYLIRVGGYLGEMGGGTLKIVPPDCSSQVPPNDNCDGAIFLVDGVAATGSTVHATNDGTVPSTTCGNSWAGPDVWYAYRPQTSGSVNVNTCGSYPPFDTVLSVYIGTCGSLTQVACNDDSSSGGNNACGPMSYASGVSVPMTAGETYWIRVAGYAGAVGSYTVRAIGGNGIAPPANDHCSAAAPVGLGATSFSTMNADSDGPAVNCGLVGSEGVSFDVWYLYSAAMTGILRVDTCNAATDFDTRLALYSGSACDSLESRLLGCDDDDPSCTAGRSAISVPVVSGRGYLIEVGGVPGASGTGVLTLTQSSHCGSADFNHDGDIGTDADIEAFFACLSGNCCASCDTADFNGDGDVGTDADIEAFFRVLAGGSC